MTETLLVVDDDSGIRSLYRAWLSGEYDVRTAADGVEALERLDGAVDVVLLDREMPRKDGETVARELQADSAGPPVVMISSVEPDVDLLGLPVDDYLEKPVERETVTAAVRRAVAVADWSRRLRRLLALDTRLAIVETAVDDHRLVNSDTYHRATATLETEMATLDDALPVTISASADGWERAASER